jgi:PAS domain S-box-containing protein
MQETITKQQTQLQLAGAQQEARVLDRTKGLLDAEGGGGLAVDHARDAVVYLDAEGSIQWINRKGSELLGRSATDLIGRSFLSFLAPKSADLARARLKAVQRKQAVASRVEFDVVRSDGGTVRVEVHASSVQEGGKVAGRLLVVRLQDERRPG